MASNYTIKNSSAKNNYFTAAGVAIASTSQPNLAGTVLSGPADSSLAAVDVGVQSQGKFRVYTGYDNVSILDSMANTLRGSAGNTKIQSPGIDQPRNSIQKARNLRVRRVSTAIRNNWYSVQSGTFTTTPAVADDFSAVGADRAGNQTKDVQPVWAFEIGGIPVTGAYPARTQ